MCGEVKDAMAINDFDIFIIACMDANIDTEEIRQVNVTKTMTCNTNDMESAKNFVCMN